MKSIARLFTLFLATAALGLPLTGCEPGNPSAKAIPTLSRIAVSPPSVTLTTGDTQALAVTGSYSDGSTETLTTRVTYTSTNTAVATVSTGGVITAVGAGTAAINLADSANAATATVSVTVNAPVPVSIAVAPKTATVTVSATQALAVTATYPNASTGALTTGLTWSTSNAAVATVSNTGVVTGVGAGTATITATHSSGPSTTATITVTRQVQTYTVLDFNTAGLTYTLTPFGDESATLTSTGVPAGGPAGQVVKITRPVGAQCWAGTTLSVGDQFSIGRVPFGPNATSMTVRIYAPAAGLNVKLKLEDATNGGITVETDVTTPVAGWQTLTFDFATPAAGTPAFNTASTYNKLSIFPNFSCGSGAPADADFYVGPITFVGAAAPSAPPLVAQVAASYKVIDFDNPAVTAGPFGAEGGGIAATGSYPAGGPTGNVYQLGRGGSPDRSFCWSGTSFGLAADFTIPVLPFSATNKKVTLQIYSPSAAPIVRMKVENAANSGISAETDQPLVVGWQTVTFDFANTAAGTSALDPAAAYNKLSIFPGFSCAGPWGTPNELGVDTVLFIFPITFLGANAPR